MPSHSRAARSLSAGTALKKMGFLKVVTQETRLALLARLSVDLQQRVRARPRVYVHAHARAWTCPRPRVYVNRDADP